MRNRLVLLACLSVLASATAIADAASTPGSCTRHAYGSLKLTPTVVVFAGRPDADEGDQRIYACVRPDGPARLLALDEADDDLYGSDAVVGEIRVAGRYAAAVVATGQASYSACTKGGSTEDCPIPRDEIDVVDARSGRAVTIPAAGTGIRALSLSPAGAVAWVEPGTLHGTALKPRGVHRLIATPRTLDTGTAFTGLRFAGLRLDWTRDGTPQTATLTG